MVKKIIIAVFIMVVVAGIGMLWALRNINALIASYQPEIERLASEALRSEVSIGDIDAAIFPGPRIRIKKLSSSSPGTSASEIFEAEDVFLSLKIMPLFEKRLEATELSIGRLQMKLIRDAQGIRMAGIPPRASAPKGLPREIEHTQSQGYPGESSEATPPQTPMPPLLRIGLERVSLADGKFEFVDELAQMSYDIRDITLTSSVALEGAVLRASDLRIKGEALGSVPIAVESPVLTFSDKEVSIPEATLSLGGSEVKIEVAYSIPEARGSVMVDSQSLDLALLKSVESRFPAVQKFSLIGALIPRLNIRMGGKEKFLSDGTIGLSGISANAANFRLAELQGTLSTKVSEALQEVSTNGLAFALNGEKVTASLHSRLSFPELAVDISDMNILGGTLRGNSQITMASPHAFSANFEAANLSITPALQILSVPQAQQKMRGTVETAAFSARGAGANLPQSLNASGNFRLRDVVLVGFNLPALVLKEVRGLPFLGEALLASVPAEYHAILNEKDTKLSSVVCRFRMEGPTLHAESFDAAGEIFTLTATGTIGFDSSLDLKTSMTFSKPFSASLVRRVRELSALLDAQGQIVIPVAVKGVAPEVLVVPDLKKLMSLGVGKIAEDLLDEALGAKGSGTGKAIKDLFGF